MRSCGEILQPQRAVYHDDDDDTDDVYSITQNYVCTRE